MGRKEPTAWDVLILHHILCIHIHVHEKMTYNHKYMYVTNPVDINEKVMYMYFNLVKIYKIFVNC